MRAHMAVKRLMRRSNGDCGGQAVIDRRRCFLTPGPPPLPLDRPTAAVVS